MRRIAILIVIGLVCLTTTAVVQGQDGSDAEAATTLMNGQSLADALMQWDGYDFTDAGDIWPGALRSGPSQEGEAGDASAA